MAISDLPTLSILRTKMQWHQERQSVLADNVSNSNTPNFRPRDLVEPKFEIGSGKVDGGATTLAMARTSTGHIGADGADPTFGENKRAGFLTRPARRRRDRIPSHLRCRATRRRCHRAPPCL